MPRLSEALKRGRSDETPCERERRENWDLLDAAEAFENEREEEKLINPQTKVLNDILSLLEVDRIFMKSFNSRLIKFIMDHRDSIDLFL